jgi:hypothetical protein
MVSDVLRVILSIASTDTTNDLRIFLGRIRAWQEFMRKGSLPLSAENEIGLIGELTLLQKMLDAGMSPDTAIYAWTGPNDGLRDFELGFGAIEVKTTIASAGFIAKIGSLEQLDDANCKPLFLGAVKFSLTEHGQTLPEMISVIRKQLNILPITVTDFEDRLLTAGYLEVHATHYHRRFSIRQITILEVTENFPRLTHGNVTPGVISARYEINLEPMIGNDIGIMAALKKLGIT